MEPAYDLKNQNFEVNSVNIIKQLLNNVDCADVTLATDDDRQLKAHKFILNANSPFFKRILQKHNHPSPLIYLKGIAHSQLDLIIKFIYSGEVKVDQNDLEDFLSACNELKIKGISEETKNMEPSRKKREKSIINKIQEEERSVLTGPHPDLNEPDRDPEVIWAEPDPVVKEELLPADINHQVGEQSVMNYENEYGYDQSEVEDESEVNPYEGQSVLGGMGTWIHSPGGWGLATLPFTENIKFDTNENGEFQCVSCEYKTKIKSHMKMHHLSKHQKVKFPCDQCEKMFSSPSALASHKKIKHLGMRIQCDLCGSKYADRSGLAIHWRKKHSSENEILRSQNELLRNAAASDTLSLTHSRSGSDVGSETINITNMS